MSLSSSTPSVVAQSNGNGRYYEELTSSSLLNKYTQNVDLTLKVIDLYQLAIKNYLNRNFIKSWELLNEIFQNANLSIVDDQLMVKIYKLYYSLYDLILKGEFPIENKSKLVHNFQTGDLYNQISLSGIDDPELYLIVFFIEKSNNIDLVLLMSHMELYLSGQNLNYNDDNNLQLKKTIELYIFNVLPYLDEYLKAESLIDRYFFNEKDEVKLRYRNRLKQIKQDIRKREREKKEQHREEKERLLLLLLLLSLKSAVSHVARDLGLDTKRDVEIVNSTTTKRNLHQDKKKKNASYISKFNKIIKRYHQQNKNLFVLLLLVIGFILSYRKNKALLINTLKMVFKVSYV